MESPLRATAMPVTALQNQNKRVKSTFKNPILIAVFNHAITKISYLTDTHSLCILWQDCNASLFMLLQAIFLLSSVRSSNDSILGDTTQNIYVSRILASKIDTIYKENETLKV